jgi:hypothetical protein
MYRSPHILTFVPLMLALAGSPALAQTTYTIFGTATPQTTVQNDNNAVTLGVKFQASTAGNITGIRFFRGATNSTGYTVALYTASGTKIGTASTPSDTCTVPCWENVNFSSPIAISANTLYTAAYFVSTGQYAGNENSMASGYQVPPLSVPVNGGVYIYGSTIAFPTQTYNYTNYYTDVDFQESTSPTLQLNVQINVSSNTPLGTAIGTVLASWSDGSPFTGTIGFGPPYNDDNGTFSLSSNQSGAQLLINPNGPGISSDKGTVQNVTLTATQ